VFIPAAEALISLELDLPTREATEGSVLTGAVLAEAGGELQVMGCEVALIRTTRYLYRQGNFYGGAATVPTRSTEVVASRGLPCAGQLPAGGQLMLPFVLTVPAEGPGTVAAALIQIQWAVRIRMQVSGSPPKESTHPIVILSRASDRDHVTAAPPQAVDRGLVALHFGSLSTRHVRPGGLITGTLGLDPRRPGSARGLRVELVLRQRVMRGPWIGTDPTRNPANETKETDTVVARQPLAHHIELDPSVPVELPFQLHAPTRLPSPSLANELFSLSWILRGVADRALRLDPYVEVELHGATAPD